MTLNGKGLFNYIVEPKNGRTTSEHMVGDKKLILNTELQNHFYTSRLGVVKATPIVEELGLQNGDEVIVHHNVFRRFYDVRGNEKNSRSYFTEDLYFVQPDQVFAYKRNGEWHSLPGFCFVKPIKETKMFSIDHEKPGIGIVKYSDGTVEQGALVGFKQGTEYEFHIEKERLYRIPSNLITIKYEYQGDEEEYNPSWTQSS